MRNLWRPSRFAIALVVAAAAILPAPAGAQFWGRPSNQSQSPRGFFPFFGGPGNSGPFYQPPQPTESTKAPAPRKVETPPTSTVVVIGDSMADWLAYGLEEALADTPDIGVVRNIRPNSGLVRYDAKNDALEWPASIKDALANDKPSAIVVMLGLNDRLPFRDKTPAKPGQQQPSQAASQPAPPKTGQQPAPAASQPAQQQGQEKQQEKQQDKPLPQDTEQPPQPTVATNEQPHSGPAETVEFHTDKWAELYSKRIDSMIAALKSKGVPVLWVGLPAVYGTRSTSDMGYLDELYRERAERAGIIYVDIWDGFVDESGRYVSSGPDFQGQIRRLRTSDGAHFTKAGAVKLAEFVAQDLRRALANHVVPVALPQPQEQPKPGVNGPRPAIGPVLPLTASANTDGNALIGDAGRTSPADPDPMATRVLVHGDPIAAPSGRSDDFSWPRPGTDANGTAEAEPAPAAMPAGPAKGAAAKVDAKKGDDAKSKAKPAPAPAPTAARPSPRADNTKAPGGGF